MYITGSIVQGTSEFQFQMNKTNGQKSMMSHPIIVFYYDT